MADSTAELLFNISANSDEATEAIESFRNAMEGDMASLKDTFADFADAQAQAIGQFTDSLHQATTAEAEQAAATEELAVAHSHAVSEIQATSGALRLLEGNGGIRAMERFTATTLGLGPAMQAIFPVVGALAFTEMIGRMVEEVHALAREWDPVAQAEQRAADTIKAMRADMQKTGEEIKKLDAELLEDAIGKPAAKMAEAAQLTSTQVAADRQMIASLQLELADAEKRIAEAKSATDEVEMERLAKQRDAAMADVKAINAQISAFQMELELNEKKAQKLMMDGAKGLLEQDKKNADAAKKTKEDFTEITSLADTMSQKLASMGGNKWQELAIEVTHYQDQLAKAVAELDKLKKTGDITADAAKRETAALAQMPAMLAQFVKEASEIIREGDTKAWGEAVQKSIEFYEQEDEEAKRAGEARVEADREIDDKLADQQEQGYARERSAFISQQNAWAAQLAKKVALTAEDWNKIDQITMEGLARIDKTEAAAWQQEMEKMRERLDSIVGADATEKEKLAADYQRDLERYSQAEEAKALKTAQTEQQRYQIEQMYATMRQQITQKYQEDLQKLINSQGWQGVFGNYFAQLIRGDQQLSEQWATSVNRSLLMLRMTFEATKEMAQQTFDSFAKGMGTTITNAFIMGKSVKQAMDQMLASTVESFAGQAATAAIMASGWGFYWLALQDYTDSANAFTSAAIFGSIAAAAAVAGKAMGSGGSGGAGGSGGSGGSGGGSSNYRTPSGAVAGSGAQQQQGTVNITVNGSVIGQSGISELTDMINQAVFGNNTQLYASHNPQGVPL